MASSHVDSFVCSGFQISVWNLLHLWNYRAFRPKSTLRYEKARWAEGVLQYTPGRNLSSRSMSLQAYQMPKHCTMMYNEERFYLLLEVMQKVTTVATILSAEIQHSRHSNQVGVICQKVKCACTCLIGQCITLLDGIPLCCGKSWAKFNFFARQPYIFFFACSGVNWIEPGVCIFFFVSSVWTRPQCPISCWFTDLAMNFIGRTLLRRNSPCRFFCVAGTTGMIWSEDNSIGDTGQ